MTRAVWLDRPEKDRWDAFVAGHPYGALCHLSAWQDVIERSFPHIRGRYLALEEGDPPGIVAGMPVYVVRSWLLGNRLVSVPFATLCDPLISHPSHLHELMPALRDLESEIGAKYLEIRTSQARDLVTEPDLRASLSYRHHYIVLDRPADELLASASHGVRRSIRKARASGLVVRRGASEGDLRAFYDLLVQTRRRLSLPPIPYRFFDSLWQVLAPRGWVSLLLAGDGERDWGGALQLNWKGVCLGEYVGYADLRLTPGITQLLYGEALKQACDEGRSLMSFGRTYRGNAGLLYSKTLWAAQSHDLCTFFHPPTTHKDTSDREASLSYRLIRFLSRRAPNPLYRQLGEFCYRHMG